MRLIIFTLLTASVLLLNGGFIAAGQAAGVAVVLIGGVAWAGWLVWDRQRWAWAPPALAALLIVAGATALLQSERALPWVYSGVVGVLAAWDLSHFCDRLGGSLEVVAQRELVAAHLRRLGLLALVAQAGLAIHQTVAPNFDFERALLFGALLIIGTGVLTRWLLRASD